MATSTDFLKQRDFLKSKWTQRELLVRRAIAQAKQQWLCQLIEPQLRSELKSQTQQAVQAS